MIACQTKAGTAGCSKLPTGWTENIGFYTTTPAAGTVSTQFPGIAYSQLTPPGQAYNTPNANGAVGLTDVMEYVNNGVQAFNKSKGTPVFITKGATTPTPQLPNGPFANFSLSPLTKSCGNLSIDVNVTYDHQANLFMLSGITNSASHNPPAICIAVSSNLENSGQSYWFSYGFNLTELQVSDGGVAAAFDYPRIGTFGDSYYVAMDYIDENSTSADYQHILGYVVCSLDRADIIQGLPAQNAQCYSYLPSRTSGYDALVHSILPVDMDGSTVASGTSGPYFFAQINPSAANTDWWAGEVCFNYGCAQSSSFIASWNWVSMSTGAAPTSSIYLANGSMPGCYNPGGPDNTVCVSQPSPAKSTDQLDGNSDRLSGRAPYLATNWTYEWEGNLVPQTEVMAATATQWNMLYPIQTPNQIVIAAIAGTGGGFFQGGGEVVPFDFPLVGDGAANTWNASAAINSIPSVGFTFTADNPGGVWALLIPRVSTLTLLALTKTWVVQPPL